MNLDEAREILAPLIEDDGGLDSFDSASDWPYTSLQAGSNSVTLDGSYTADRLEAIAVWMRSHES